MNTNFCHGNAELIFKAENGDITQRVVINRVDVNHHIAEITHAASRYREFVSAGLPEVTLTGYIPPQPAPLSDKDWEVVSGIVAAAGTVAKKEAESVDLFLRHGWITVQEARHLLGMAPLEPHETPVGLLSGPYPFTEQDWADVHAAARTYIENWKARELADFLERMAEEPW